MKINEEKNYLYLLKVQKMSKMLKNAKQKPYIGTCQ